jgi:hypothetical protein
MIFRKHEDATKHAERLRKEKPLTDGAVYVVMLHGRNRFSVETMNRNDPELTAARFCYL